MREKLHQYHYAKLPTIDDALVQIQSMYAKWIVGQNAKQKKRRLNLGVDPALTVQNFQQAQYDYINDQCIISSRLTNDQWLMRFEHIDPKNPQIWWCTHVRWANEFLEHGTAQRISKGGKPRIVGSIPQVIRTLDEREIIEAYLIQHTLTPMRADEIDDYVNYHMDDPDTLMGTLVISPKQGKYLVNGAKLLKDLASVTRVVLLSDERATKQWEKSLKKRLGMSTKTARCFDGAIRLYYPPTQLKPDQSPSFTWLPEHLPQNIEHATTQLLNRIGRMLALRLQPPSFFQNIQKFDDSEAQKRREQIRHKAEQPYTRLEQQHRALQAELAALQGIYEETEQSLQELEQQYEALQASAQETDELLELAYEEHEQLTQQKQQLEQQRDVLNQTNHVLEADKTNLQAQLQSLKQSNLTKGQLTSIELEILQKHLLQQPLSLEESLLMLKAIWPKRVILLDSAITSAKEASDFNKSQKATNLLITLITKYLDECQERGEGAAKKLFNDNQYASNESKQHRSGKAKDNRTFDYEGEPIFFCQHLKIGNGKSTKDGWRCHFYHDSAKGCIVIGHCGKHLDF